MIRAKSHIMASPGGCMRPIKVLFYIDSGTMVTHCVTAAELIRKELGAHIVMMIVDAHKYVDETTRNYEIYDYGSLFSIPQRLKRVWPRNVRTRGRLRWSNLSRLLRYPSLVTAGKKIGMKSKVVQVFILPPLFFFFFDDDVSTLALCTSWAPNYSFRATDVPGSCPWGTACAVAMAADVVASLAGGSTKLASFSAANKREGRELFPGQNTA